VQYQLYFALKNQTEMSIHTCIFTARC